MSNIHPALLGALLLCSLSGEAWADAAMLSKQSAIHRGPGTEFEIVGYLDAGRIQLGRCGPNARQENWCLVEHPTKPGWIHVVLRDAVRRGGAGSIAQGDGGGKGPNDVAEDDSTNPDVTRSKRLRAAGSGDGKSGGGGNEGMSPTDATSLPGDDGSGRGTGGGLTRPSGAGENAPSKAKLGGSY